MGALFPVHPDTLSQLSPTEQAVYVRLSLLAEHGRARGRYADLAKAAHVSLSTFKRVVKALQGRGLVEVVWRQKTPSLFILREQIRARADTGPKWYDRLAPDDRALFLVVKRSVPPLEMKALQREALASGEDVDKLIFKKHMGPERQQPYAHLL